jgi:GTP-binding protein EngB required for normal cell division
MKISITLNKQIQCEYICSQIQKAINRYQQHSQDLSGAVLVIDIVQVTDGGDSHIPKLEYYPDCNS